MSDFRKQAMELLKKNVDFHGDEDTTIQYLTAYLNKYEGLIKEYEKALSDCETTKTICVNTLQNLIVDLESKLEKAVEVAKKILDQNWFEPSEERGTVCAFCNGGSHPMDRHEDDCELVIIAKFLDEVKK